MISLFLFVFFLTSHLSTVQSDCSVIELCNCDENPNEIICDGNSGNQTDNNDFPMVSLLPSVEKYVFLNFKQIQERAFENMTFLTNNSITITLINVTTIESNAFSSSMIIPENSTISIDIEHSIHSSSITLKSNAFNRLKIERLRFFNIKHFNGRSIFDTNCLGESLYINELIFEQSGITGFSNIIRKAANVKRLLIHHCPTLTQLTDKSLPSFLATTESLEISTTGLQLINPHTFTSWTLVLKELILRNNIDLKIFPTDVVEGSLFELNKLDLSNNSISTLDQDYNWFPYSYTKHLILKQQQLDLFLKSKILKSLSSLTTIDFSHGFIGENNDDLISDYFFNMSNLISINISYTNFTENMVIDLLKGLSKSSSRNVHISLLGHTLNNENFCSYFTIFQQAPNLLHLELDETHPCNCIVDLFYDETTKNDLLQQPTCLSNTTRTRCDIDSQLIVSKCPITRPNPDSSGTNPGNAGTYAFVGIMVGLGVVLLIVLGIGSGAVYRKRRNRRMTVLDMEEPIENPLAIIIEERLQKSN
jgi:hypothetical protein